MQTYNWPYKNELDITETLSCDVLVLGGGLAGCYAAIAAARRGQSVILVEKGATARSGSAGTGFDHWESACTNPCSQVTPEEIAEWIYFVGVTNRFMTGQNLLIDGGEAGSFDFVWPEE